MEEFDYVVVGGGSAGCVVASRLTEDPRIRVCLLEAGGAGDTWMVKAPLGIAIMVPSMKNNWAFETVPQPGLNGRIGYQPRGKALGGSSAINAMVYIRGHRVGLRSMGGARKHRLVVRRRAAVFQEVREQRVAARRISWRRRATQRRRTADRESFQQHFLDAAQALQLPLNRDFNGAQQEGVGPYQVTQRDGQRWSAARAYLTPNLARSNLKIITGAQARKVVFEGRRAVAVEFSRAGSNIERVKARAEIVLSGGAFDSPQLLMLSGVGNASTLKTHGIGVVHHAPEVGRNLQDHIDFAFSYRSKSVDNFGISFQGLRRLWGEIGRYRRDGRGMITSNVAECGGFLRTDPSLTVPDIQLHFSMGMADNHGRTRHLGHGFGCHVCLLRPKSRGSVTLAGPDAAAAPVIDPKFYDHPDDIEVMVKGFKLTRRIMDAPPLAKWRTAEMYSEGVTTDDDIRGILRARSDTVYHPVGTARMGAGRSGRRRSAIARARRRAPARRRRLDHADADRRQHQRTLDHDRRKGCRHDPHPALRHP